MKWLARAIRLCSSVALLSLGSEEAGGTTVPFIDPCSIYCGVRAASDCMPKYDFDAAACAVYFSACMISCHAVQ